VTTEETLTWRTLVGKITSDPHERHRIAEVLGVNQVTLTRWAQNKSTPRQDNLHTLLEALPLHRKQLVELIKKEFPTFFSESAIVDDTPQEIPSAFYDRILKAHTTSPALLRTSSITILILQQLLGHLDPHKGGMAITLASCLPPSKGHKVRSLRQTLGRGTPPWGSHLENQTMFLGAESPAGYAIIKGHPTIAQNTDELKQLFPIHSALWEESVISFPLLQAHRVAGSLVVASTQDQYFTPARQDLIQKYADLLVLAFEHDHFYDLQDIELGIMPPYAMQQSRLSEFQQRVTYSMIKSAQSGDLLTRPEAEQIVWQEFEEEFLHLLFNT
jgi:transcriptional regulator with XRE-family HTH domain